MEILKWSPTLPKFAEVTFSEEEQKIIGKDFCTMLMRGKMPIYKVIKIKKK